MTNHPHRSYQPRHPTYLCMPFLKWWKLANRALINRGLPAATAYEAHDAYEVGDTPENFADAVFTNTNRRWNQ